MLKENETDTFISVDSELRRVALNCSVYEYRGEKGGRREGECKCTFQSSSLSSFSSTSAPALDRLNRPSCTHKYHIKCETHN